MLLPKSWLIAPPEQDLAMAATAGADAVVLDLRGLRTATNMPFLAGADAALLPSVASVEMAMLLDHCTTAKIATVILSGPRNGADLQHLDVLLQVAEARAGLSAGTTRIVAMAGDNPHGLLAAASFAGKSERLVALGWDAGALAIAMKSKTGIGADVAASARATLSLAAAAANVAAIDTAEPGTDAEAFRTACLHAKAQGFTGKMTGTFCHAPIIRSVFAD